MGNIVFAIAKFKISKNDFYAIEIIEKFETYEQASEVFSIKNYANAGGGTWQESYNYEIIDIKDRAYCYHNGNEIKTIFD